jgi:hypothetical protein
MQYGAQCYVTLDSLMSESRYLNATATLLTSSSGYGDDDSAAADPVVV